MCLHVPQVSWWLCWWFSLREISSSPNIETKKKRTVHRQQRLCMEIKSFFPQTYTLAAADPRTKICCLSGFILTFAPSIRFTWIQEGDLSSACLLLLLEDDAEEKKTGSSIYAILFPSHWTDVCCLRSVLI